MIPDLDKCYITSAICFKVYTENFCEMVLVHWIVKEGLILFLNQ